MYFMSPHFTIWYFTKNNRFNSYITEEGNLKISVQFETQRKSKFFIGSPKIELKETTSFNSFNTKLQILQFDIKKSDLNKTLPFLVLANSFDNIFLRTESKVLLKTGQYRPSFALVQLQSQRDYRMAWR